MISKGARAICWLIPFCLTLPCAAQTPKTLWSTPDELNQWIAPADSDDPPSIQVMTDSTGSFVRVSPVLAAQIGIPGLATVNGANFGNFPVLIATGSQNAIRIRARHNTALQSFDGLWVHRSTTLTDEIFQSAPFFAPQPFPGDGAWHDLTFMFSDSPLYDSQSDVVGISLGFFAPHFQDDGTVERLASQTPPTAYLDISRIEFISVPETLLRPTITDFQPRKGVQGDSVTITGSGFAQPFSRNFVLFGATGAEIISGDSSTLLVHAADNGPLSVRVPGGATAVSPTSFLLLGPPDSLLIVSGDGQVAPPGTALQAFQVTLADFKNRGIPGRTINFSIVSGAGTLSQNSAVTDASGVASVVLTLGSTAGAVSVQANFTGLAPVTFNVMATSH